MTKLKAGDRTKRDILQAGIRLWIACNGHVNAHQIGMAIGLTHSAILYHFNTIAELREAIANFAVSTGNSKIIMHLISMNHEAIAKMSVSDRNRHIFIAQR